MRFIMNIRMLLWGTPGLRVKLDAELLGLSDSARFWCSGRRKKGRGGTPARYNCDAKELCHQPLHFQARSYKSQVPRIEASRLFGEGHGGDFSWPDK